MQPRRGNELPEKVTGDNWKLTRTKERFFSQANGKQNVNDADQLRKLENLSNNGDLMERHSFSIEREKVTHPEIEGS
jgi:hypothetical protein